MSATTETEFRNHLAMLLELATDAKICVDNATLAADRSFVGELPALGEHMARLQRIARRMQDTAIDAEIEINMAIRGQP